MYFRLGHVNQIFVKTGDRVARGQRIATNGTGNNQWYAHTHLDLFKEKPSSWTKYNIGWSKEATLNVWKDPRPYMHTVMPDFHHYGYEFLELATYKAGNCYHPGVDLNGPGAGNADLDIPLFAPVDGVIEYIYGGNLSNGGWGKLILIKEEPMSDCYKVDSKLRNAIEDITDGDYGKMDSEKLQEEAAEDLEKECDKIKNELEVCRKANERLAKEAFLMAETINELEDKIKNQTEMIVTLTKKIADQKKTIEEYELEGKIINTFDLGKWTVIIKEKPNEE